MLCPSASVNNLKRSTPERGLRPGLCPLRDWTCGGLAFRYLLGYPKPQTLTLAHDTKVVFGLVE